MRPLLTPQAKEDLAYWERHDTSLAVRIRQLFDTIACGKTLPLHHLTQLKFGTITLMSLKIAAEHRLVFEHLDDQIIVHQCRFHY